MTCKNKKLTCILHVVVFLMLLLPACQGDTPFIRTSTSTPRLELTATTPSSSPTQTVSPTPTVFFSPRPDDTKTPTPTSTPEPPNLSLTPIASTLSPITANQLDQVEHLAVWGNGAAEELSLAADGNLLIVGTDLGAFIYDSFDFRFYALLRSKEPVMAVAPSPDNKLIAVLEGQSRLAIYNQDTFERITEIKLSKTLQPSDTPPSLFFSPESENLILLNPSIDQITILRWEVASWEQQTSYSVNRDLGSFVNPDIGILGVISEDNLILHSLMLPGDFRTLPLAKNDLENLIDRLSTSPQPMIPAKEGDFLLLNLGETVASWDIVNGEIDYQLEPYPQEAEDPCESIAETCRNKEGNFSFSCAEDSTESQRPIRLLAITPDDQRMLISLNSGRTELRSTYSGELIWEIDIGYTKALFSLEYRFLLGLRPNGVIEKRDLLDGELLRVFKQHPKELFALDFSPDGNLLAAGYGDGWIRIYNTQTGEMLGILEGNAQSLQFAPDGETLAAGLVDGALRIFQLNLSQYFNLSLGHQGSVTGLAYLQDGMQLISTGLDCAISRWNISDRYRIDTLVAQEQNPTQLIDLEIPQGRDIIYAAGKQGIFAIEEDQVEKIFAPDPEKELTDITVSPDSGFLAASGNDLWLLQKSPSGWQTLSIQISSSSEENTFRVAFLPDANILLAANSQSLRFYSIDQSQGVELLQQLPMPPTLGVPVDLAVSSHGELIAIGSENGLIHLFGIP